ncbi:MAG: DUF2066 domain-containing protein [Ectothiorhodospiraceae bacterium]|nr:DUF2066 domain-containing protein [Ectothiorhodospiraceae bacterium]
MDSTSRRYWRFVVGMAILALGIGTATADLYDARVAVGSESGSERAQGAAEGMEKVLLRLTGDASVVEQSRVRERLLSRAERFVQQFGYADRDDDEEGLWLQLRYDGPAVERTLTELEVPFWARADRPRTLAWFAVDQAGSRELVGGGVRPDLQEQLQVEGRRLGLQLLFPLQDLEDQRNLSPSDVWGGFRAPIMDASDRYGTESVLVVRMASRGPGQWTARWIWFYEGDAREWSASGDSVAEALEAGMAEGARLQARQLARAPSATDQRAVSLYVEDLTGVRDYGYLVQLLGDTRGVRSVDVVRVSGDAVELRVMLDGDPERFDSALRANRRLQRLQQSETPVDYAFRLAR